MGSKFYYSQIITNEYLNFSREVKGATRIEVYFKANEQKRKWAEQEKKKRERDSLADLKAQSEYDTKSVLALIELYKGILAASLKQIDPFNWESLKDYNSFHEPIPNKEKIRLEMNVPQEKKLLEYFFVSKNLL